MNFIVFLVEYLVIDFEVVKVFERSCIVGEEEDFLIVCV